MKIVLGQISYDRDRQVYGYDILADGRKVGFAQLRLKPSKSDAMPAGFESHVYYEVDELSRGRGIATAALGQLSQIARSNGLKQVIITVNNDNLASRRVIEKSGGTLVDESVAGNKQVSKFVIETGRE